jgi:hypothetical protein
MLRIISFFFSVLIMSFYSLKAQDDLLALFEDEEPTTEYTFASFKTTRVINSHSIENPAPGVLLFMIQHRFGQVNTGIYELFGLDQATIRLGFEYGVNDRLSLGFGRSSFEKTYDGFAKFKLLRQSTGIVNMPLTCRTMQVQQLLRLNGRIWEWKREKTISVHGWPLHTNCLSHENSVLRSHTVDAHAGS